MIELLVVMVLAGAIMTVGYQLLQSIWQEKLSGAGQLSLEGLFQSAREKALLESKILVLEINMDEKTAGIRAFDPALEPEMEPSLSRLWTGRDNRTRKVRDELLAEEDTEEQEPPERNWIVEPSPLPPGLVKVRSVSGLEIAGPYISIHFYPDGTSDSILFEFEDEKKMLFLPRHNVPARYVYRNETTEVAIDEANQPQ